MRSRRCFLMLALLLCFASGSARTAATGDAERTAVSSTLARLEAAMNARDMKAIEAQCAADSALRGEIRSRLAPGLTLDSLGCRLHLNSLATSGDTVVAVVSEETTWSENHRTQADVSYRTYGFVREGERRLLAADRERDYARARWTELELELHPGEGTLSGQERLTIGISAGGEDHVALALNRGLRLSRIETGSRIEGANGVPLPYTRYGPIIVLELPQPLAAGDSIVCSLQFEGTLFNERSERGYSQVGIAPAGCFASWVTDWYPHLNGTGSKSPGMISFTAPAELTVASSGRQVASSEQSGRRRTVFRVGTPLDFSFAAAPYFHQSRVVDGVDLGVYFLRGGEAKADRYIGSCAQVLAFQHEIYGFYPYDGYSVVEIPPEAVGALGGSSEQGMNLFPAGILPDSTFPLPLLAHEMGHSWWGNLVRSDLPVIDEGLAQTTSLLCVEHIQGHAAMRRYLRRGFPDYMQSSAMYFRHNTDGRDLPLDTRPVDGDQSSKLHELADTKGFFVFEMLRETIGDEAFIAGLRSAVARYARAQIRLSDLERIWSQAAGRDLRFFFHQWFERNGAPEFTLRYVIEPGAGGGYDVRGAVSQGGEPYEVDADLVTRTDGHIERLHITGTETPFAFHTTDRPDTVLFDPEFRILRWTPELRNLELLARAAAMRQAGARDSASVMLAEYVRRVPDGIAGHAELGRYALEGNDLERAEREFDRALRVASLCDSTDPAIARSAVGLGIIADLRRHRDEAVVWYRKALAAPGSDESGEEASRYLADACVSVPRPPRPPRSLLEACAGTYAMEPGMRITVSIAAGDVLTVTSPEGAHYTLISDGGARFHLVEASGVKLEFGGDGEGSGANGNAAGYTIVRLEMTGRTMELKRVE
jgi:hypothetical protein